MLTEMDKPTTREELTALLSSNGWKLIYSERFTTSSFEIWEKPRCAYQLRLSWPKDGNCNGATTVEGEIDKALRMIADN